MCDVVEIPIGAFRELQAVACHMSNDEDALMNTIETIMNRFHIALDDPIDLWDAYVDWSHPIRDYRRVQ